MFRPPPIGGHIRLLQYHRYLSNRLREYGPFERFINYPKLLIPITLHDIYDMNRYFIALKHVVMGVVPEERLPFQDSILPDLGMECGALPEPVAEAAAVTP